jgi:hypothetical protein
MRFCLPNAINVIYRASIYLICYANLDLITILIIYHDSSRFIPTHVSDIVSTVCFRIIVFTVR